jgi:1-aminocyclopropane-1-carboxylate deaminase/D-cysteine desulfhydrase-like pyridoxal-dependent ACC family enzyme
MCCACGTGGTMAGLVASMNGQKNLLGFPILKNGYFLKNDIDDLISSYTDRQFNNWDLITDFHFGGYAKYDDQLIQFINRFKKKHDIQLDPIYTGKLLYAIFQLIKTKWFRTGEKILAIHTGGLQGIRGFNARFGQIIYL